MQHASLDIIQSIALILLAAGLMGALLSFVRMPAVLAFILTGILIGPGGLGLVSNTEIINTIAELGIIFLLFVLGAELSLPRLKEMRIHSLWAGIIQMVLTIIVFSIAFYGFGLSPRSAIFLAGALALSSTAIVIKMLESQGELETPHGRITMGILIVQDLSLVPLMAFMPMLTEGGSGDDMLYGFLGVLLKSVLFLGTVLFLSWRFIPKLIDKIAAVSSKEIFAVFVVAFGLLIASLAQMAGLSYAVGAFIAGLTLSKSVTSRQIVAETLPFRDIFSTVFFVSVGMLMNIQFLLANLPLILLVMGLIILVKAITVGLSVYLLRFPYKTVMWCSLSLFQVGEFSFILLQNGLRTGTLSSTLLNTINSAVVLTMIATPLVIRAIPAMLKWLEGQVNVLNKIELVFPQERIQPLKDEVVIAGYGPIAKNLVHILQAHEVGFRIIEMNIQTVKKLQAQGIHCVFGDASNAEVLKHAGIQDARVFALTIPDVRSAELAVQNAKRLNPDIYCIVRSRYQHPLQQLFIIGCDEVVYEEFETSMSFIYSILDIFGDYITDKESYMLLLRENRKALLRTGKDDEDQARYGRFSVFKDTKIEWLTVPEGSPLIGMTLADAALRQKSGVNILSVIEPDGQEQPNPEATTVIQANQILVVIGTLEQLESLEAVLC
jgi:monovalent cation:H+ antiporter-2, CPA2 family